MAAENRSTSSTGACIMPPHDVASFWRSPRQPGRSLYSSDTLVLNTHLKSVIAQRDAPPESFLYRLTRMKYAPPDTSRCSPLITHPTSHMSRKATYLVVSELVRISTCSNELRDSTTGKMANTRRNVFYW